MSPIGISILASGRDWNISACHLLSSYQGMSGSQVVVDGPGFSGVEQHTFLVMLDRALVSLSSKGGWDPSLPSFDSVCPLGNFARLLLCLGDSTVNRADSPQPLCPVEGQSVHFMTCRNLLSSLVLLENASLH